MYRNDTHLISGPPAPSLKRVREGLKPHGRRRLMAGKIILSISLLFSTVVWSQEVPKDQWILAMQTAVPVHFCSAEQYFRQCFQVSASECEETAASGTRNCLRQVQDQIPDKLVQPRDGNFWGNQVGRCAGIAYEAALADKRISNPKCNDASSWQSQ